MHTTKKLENIGLDDYKMGEAYFMDMAEQGLFLEDAGLLCYTFRKDMPQKERYCIQSCPKGCTKEMAQHMNSRGWTYICDDDGFYVFRGEDNAEDVEISIEDEMNRWKDRQGESKKRISSLLMVGIFFLLTNFFTRSGGFFGGGFLLNVTFGLALLYQIIGELHSLKKAKGCIVCLTKGELPEDENWKRKNILVWAENFLMVAVWLLLIFGRGIA